MNWNKQGRVGLPLFSPVAPCSIAAAVAAVHIVLSSAPLALPLKGMSACMSEIRGVCVCLVCVDREGMEALVCIME